MREKRENRRQKERKRERERERERESGKHINVTDLHMTRVRACCERGEGGTKEESKHLTSERPHPVVIHRRSGERG